MKMHPWLVSARSDVQRTLLDVERILAHRSKALGTSVTKDDVYVMRALTDVGFCLWRAVFLINNEFSPHEMLVEMKRFLTNVVEDNAISYTQDKNNAKYTSIFYLRTAIMHIDDFAGMPLVKRGALVDHDLMVHFEAKYKVLKDIRVEMTAALIFTNYQGLFEATLDVQIALVNAVVEHFKIGPLVEQRQARFPQVRVS
jgi:hypothetical protein